jgi:hypothetical protein
MTPALARTAVPAPLKAICYKCSYVGMGIAVARCPTCAFPLIFQAQEDGFAPDIERLFDRSSVRMGAPPLPGVDASPRKAQLLMEARRRRVERRRAASERDAHRQALRRSARSIAIACLGAFGFGLITAAVLSGAL